jgi:hypothetical protein
MTRRHLAVALLLIVAATTATAQEAPGNDGPLQPQLNPGPRTYLTVATVLSLHEANVDDSVILAKLAQANHPLDLSTDDILQLKQAGISDPVVRAMIAPDPGGTGPQRLIVRDESFEKFHSMNPTGATLPYGTDDARIAMNDPFAAHDSGIYLAKSSPAGTDSLQFLDRAAIKGVTANIGAVFSFFAYPVTVKYEITGPRAVVRTKDPKPTFYFYFEDKSAGLGKSMFSNTDVSTPTQFQLERFATNKKERLLAAGKFGIFVGVSDGQKPISFTTERIRPGLYKITVDQPLKPGEYVLAAPPPNGAIGPLNNSNTDPNTAPKPDLFDFAIDPQ